MVDIEFFLNSRMKVLLIINKNQVEAENIYYCPLNQQQIANKVPCSKLKVNQILKELINEDYVEMLRSKGRYAISPKGIGIIDKLL